MDHAGRAQSCISLEISNHEILRKSRNLNSNHETLNTENFKISNMDYNNNTYKSRISDTLFVKQYCPCLNMQDNSVPLQLFNWF